MTSISLSAIVNELSRRNSHQAYLLVSDTEQKAADMYAVVKNEILARGVPHRIINFAQGVSNLPDPLVYQQDYSLLLLENTFSVSADQSERLNEYVKRLTDYASGPMLWYLSVYTYGQINSGYGSRARSAFVTLTKVIADA